MKFKKGYRVKEQCKKIKNLFKNNYKKNNKKQIKNKFKFPDNYQ